MIARASLFAAVLVFAAAACSTKNDSAATADTAAPATMSAADPQSVRQFLDSSVVRFKEAFIRGDTTVILADYTDDAVLVASGVEHRGRAAIAKWYADGFREATVKDLKVSIDDVMVGGDLAVEISSFEGTDQPKKGGPESKYKGKNVLLWKRQADGSWKMVYDITSAAPPPKS